MLETLIKHAISPAIKAAGFLFKLTKSRLEKDFHSYKLLRKIYKVELKEDFNSIYIATLYNLIVEQNKNEGIIKLFNIREVQEAFQKELYENNNWSFQITLDSHLHTNQTLRVLKNQSVDLQKEIEDFRQEFNIVVNKTRSPKEIEGKNAVDSIQQVTKQILNNTASLSSDLLSRKDEYLKDLEYPKQLRSKNNPKQALDYLNSFQDTRWDLADDTVKYKVLSARGYCFLELNQTEKAAPLFIKALQYNPDDENALANTALAYTLFRDAEADKFIAKTISKNPLNILANSCKISRNQSVDFQEILNSVPIGLSSSAEIAYSLGIKARDLDIFDKAIEWLKKSLENSKGKHVDIKGSLASTLMESISNPFHYITKQYDTERISIIKQAIKLFDDVFEELKDTDLLYAKSWWFIKRAVGKKILGDREGALDDIKKAFELSPKDPYCIKHLGIAFAEIGNHKKAIEVLESAKQYAPSDLEIELSICESYYEWGKYSEAIARLKGLDLSTVTKGDVVRAARLLMINSLFYNEQNNDAIDLAKSFLKEETDRLPFLVSLSWIYRKLNDKQNLDFYLTEASTQITDTSSSLDINNLAAIYNKEGKYKEAISLLERITNRNALSSNTSSLLLAYFHAKEYGKAINLISNLKEQRIFSDYLIDFEATIYCQISDYKRAKDVCSDYLSSDPKNTVILFRLSQIYHLLNDIENLRSTLYGIESFDALTMEARFDIAKLYLEIDEPLNALEIAYETRRENYSTGRVHLLYFYLVVSIDNKTMEAYINLPQVEIDATVLLRDIETNNEIQKTILNSRNVRPERHEIDVNDALSKKLLGRTQGDIIELERKLGFATNLQIVSIVSKYQSAFTESVRLLESDYLEIEGFKSFKLKQTGESEYDIKASLKPIFEALDQDETYDNELNKLYKAGSLTIGVYSKLKGTNPIKIWHKLVSDRELGIISGGLLNEFQAGIGLIQSGKDILLDITSLLTFHHSGTLEYLERLNNKKYVCQTTLNEINDLLKDLEFSASKGQSFSIGKVNGEYVKEVRSEEQQKATIEFYANLKGWIVKHTAILPSSHDLRVNLVQKQDREKLMGKSFLDTIYASIDNDALLISDDERFRSHALSEYGIYGTNSYTIYEFGRRSHSITMPEYTKAISMLFLFYYRGIPLSAQVLYQIVDDSQFKVSNAVQYAFQILANDKCSVQIKASICSQFFKQLYLQTSLESIRVKIGFPLLIEITKFNNKDNFLTLLNAIIEKDFMLLPVHKKDLLGLIATVQNYGE